MLLSSYPLYFAMSEFALPSHLPLTYLYFHQLPELLFDLIDYGEFGEGPTSMLPGVPLCTLCRFSLCMY